MWDIMPLYSSRKRIIRVIFKNASPKVHFSQAFSFSSPSVSMKCFPTKFRSFTFNYATGYLQRSEINPAWISAYSSLNLHYSHNSRSPLNWAQTYQCPTAWACDDVQKLQWWTFCSFPSLAIVWQQFKMKKSHWRLQ